MPSWLNSNCLCITKTLNGWSVAPEPNTPAHSCVAFSSWADLVDWLATNWAEQGEQ